jgi:hypothetical protein
VGTFKPNKKTIVMKRADLFKSQKIIAKTSELHMIPLKKNSLNHMKQKLLILSSFIFAALLQSCILSPTIKGDGNVTEQNREVSSFSEMKISRGMNVYITQGNNTSVRVVADANLLDVIETEVEGDVLVVSSDANIKKCTSKKVYVTTPNLEVIKAFAGCNVYSESTIDTEELQLSASAGSTMKITVKADQLHTSASAGSNISIEGEAETIKGKASSGSNIKAGNLSTSNSELKVSSGANIWITCTQKLNGSASSGGNIFYAGNPSNTEIHKSSGGNVIKQ